MYIWQIALPTLLLPGSVRTGLLQRCIMTNFLFCNIQVGWVTKQETDGYVSKRNQSVQRSKIEGKKNSAAPRRINHQMVVLCNEQSYIFTINYSH